VKQLTQVEVFEDVWIARGRRLPRSTADCRHSLRKCSERLRRTSTFGLAPQPLVTPDFNVHPYCASFCLRSSTLRLSLRQWLRIFTLPKLQMHALSSLQIIGMHTTILRTSDLEASWSRHHCSLFRSAGASFQSIGRSAPILCVHGAIDNNSIWRAKSR